MQPDDENNYWNKESDQTVEDEITETYAPENDIEEPEINDTKLSANEPVSEKDLIHWSAKEYIDNEKNSLWFVAFSFVVLGLIAADILFLKSYTFSALVLVMAIAIIVFSKRPARDIDYTLSGNQGLYVGEKLYHFSEFKAFGVVNDYGYYYVMLIPVKRFSLGVSVYFPSEVGEQVVDILGARLPMQDQKMDIFDKIVRKLRI
jgi:hypothetical protein